MPDFAARRRTMVDTQVRPSDVTRFPIIESLLHVPRERFVPDAMIEAAYAGDNLVIAPGRVLLDPRTLSKMLDALEPQPDDLVLDLACGTGYSSAVIARLAQAVVAVEPDPELAAEAESLLSALGVGNVVVEQARAEIGAPVHGPYDAMILQGAIETFPEALAAQLKDGGRVVALFNEGGLGIVRLGLCSAGLIRWRDLFHAGAPVLPGFARPPAFAL